MGWTPVGFSEIEPFPSAVLKHHYPSVPNYGDMTTLPDRILSGEIEAPDLLVGGTPCQAFSVAGLRNSLNDDRGNLSLTFIGIANAIDHIRSSRGLPPVVILWENVPGVFSTKDNAFGCFLAGLAGEGVPLQPAGGKWTYAGSVLSPKRSIAWRTLDAQFFGVAQRRRRCFVVASARTDFNPATVLFEFEGVRRDIAPSRSEGKDIATDAKASAPDGGHTVGTLMARDYKGIGNQDLQDGRGLVLHQVYENHGTDSRIKPVDVCPTVTSRWGTGGNNVPLKMEAFSVRRLTPVECERLQGFPDNYTNIPWRNKPESPDSPRYKAMGNSMALPVMRWIGERIQSATLVAHNDNNELLLQKTA